MQLMNEWSNALALDCIIRGPRDLETTTSRLCVALKVDMLSLYFTDMHWHCLLDMMSASVKLEFTDLKVQDQ